MQTIDYHPVANSPYAYMGHARLIIAAEEVSTSATLELAGHVLKAVWEQERNIADEVKLVALADEAGWDGTALLLRSKAPEILAQHDAHTQGPIDRQVFGAPTYLYRDELFWGQDQLDFLERALQRCP